MIIEITKGKTLYILHTISPVEITLSIRHLATMLKSGLAMEDAIKTLTKQVGDQKLRVTYEKILKDIQSGVTLADSMKNQKGIFSQIITSIIDIGEQGGTLEKNLEFLADYLKKSYELSRKLKGATTYPMVILFLTMFEMLGVIFFIIPKLEGVFSSFAETPPLTKAILNISAFVRNNGAAILVGVILFLIVLSKLLATRQGKIFKDHLALVMPILKVLNRYRILSTFSRTLGILLESGIPLQKALKITQDTIGNVVYEKAIADCYEVIKTGQNLTEALNRHPKEFPITFSKMIEVAEQTGALEANLNYLYDFYTEEVTDMSNNLTTLIEPLLLIIVGLMIGGLALFIITPIYQLSGSINGM